MKTIAVVNSKSFGKHFPKHFATFVGLGGVDILTIDPNLKGEKLADRLEKYEYLVTGVTPTYDRAFFEHSPQLKLIARHGLGFDNIDIAAADEAKVYVTKVTGSVAQEAVAEQALSLILSLMRGIPQADQALRNQAWATRSDYCGKELYEATVGIIGYGNIGSRLGSILHHGFQAKVLVFDPYQSEEEIAKQFGIKVSLEELLSQAEVISLHASLNHENAGLLGRAEFALVRSGALLINTARGQLVKTKALVKALRKGTIAGYAADVFEAEPIEADHPLLAFENVILTPHIGAYTYPSLKGMGETIVAQVVAVSEGNVPDGVIHQELGEEQVLDDESYQEASD